MSEEELHKLLTPPGLPVEIPADEDWQRCESYLGKLPSDYRRFLATYGTGTVDDFIWIFNPGSENEYLELEAAARSNLEALRETAAQFPDDYPMARYPEPGGFLPFGVSDNGDTLYWETRGDPEEWTVAVMGPRAREVYRFDGGLVEFLVALLSRKVVCDRFPSDFPGDGPVQFTAATGR